MRYYYTREEMGYARIAVRIETEQAKLLALGLSMEQAQHLRRECERAAQQTVRPNHEYIIDALSWLRKKCLDGATYEDLVIMAEMLP